MKMQQTMEKKKMILKNCLKWGSSLIFKYAIVACVLSICEVATRNNNTNRNTNGRTEARKRVEGKRGAKNIHRRK